MVEFSQMGLRPELVEALRRIGFVTATEVQEHAVPVALKGKDVMVRAKTGTGKTGAFLTAIFNNIVGQHGLSTLIIVPTRELALQVSSVAAKIGTPMHVKTVTVYGGASINVQVEQIRRGVNIVVGTPGRVIDLMKRHVLNIEHVKHVVLDEADTMLDMGFIDDIDYILSMTPFERQTMMFSATMPKQIIDIARGNMKQDYETIVVGKEEEHTVAGITHNYAIANGRLKFLNLLAYIDHFKPEKAIIFTSTQRESDLLHRVLSSQGLDTVLLHGGLTQAKREHSLQRFRSGARFLIATNVAARGLDIADVTDVINFDAPDSSTVYIHRVGRSARMGKTGRAFTLIGTEQRNLVMDIKYEANVDIKELRLNVEKFRNVSLDLGGHGHGGGGRFGGGMRPGFRKQGGEFRNRGYGHHQHKGGFQRRGRRSF